MTTLDNNNKIVLVFKTSVLHDNEAKILVEKLLMQFPTHRVNFDLDDCDNILRMEGTFINHLRVTEILINHQYHCVLLGAIGMPEGV